MKRALPFAFGLLVVAGCTGLNAQTLDLRTNIPFAFNVSGTTMPAGEYSIHHSQGLLTLREEQGKAVSVITVGTDKWNESSHPLLQFERYGDEYFLGRISVPESAIARQLLESRREKELAAASGRGEAVIVAVRTK
jgi:hypothetical protein